MKKRMKKTNRLETNLGGGTGIYTVYYNTTILVATISNWYSTVFTHTLQCFFNFCTLISVVLCLQNLNIESLC